MRRDEVKSMTGSGGREGPGYTRVLYGGST